MPTNIEIKDDLSINDLLELSAQQYSVTATPHIGNLPPRVVGLMSLGFGVNFVDTNVGIKDVIFHPHRHIQKGISITIANPQALSTHNKVPNGANLIDYHFAPLRQMNFKPISHTEWVKNRQEDIHKVLTLLNTDRYKALWKRYVSSDGLAGWRERDNKSVLDNVHKVSSPSNEKGWVIPNPINILLDLVFAARESDKDTVYMLSGMTMYKYIKKNYDHFGPMDRLISDMYDLVRAGTTFGLPDKLQVNMVPMAALNGFVVPMGAKDLLDRELKCFHKTKAGKSRCGRKFAAQELSLSIKIRLQKKRNQFFRNTSDALSVYNPNVNSGIFYTQHDLAADRDKIYIPNEIMSATVKQLTDMTESMQKFSH